ncbi:MAG: MoaD/ThiS family protein [Natronomonas sp.]
MDVIVYGSLRGATGSKETTIEFDGGTVEEAIAAFVEAYPRTRRMLFDDGDLRSSVRAQLDGERVEPTADCPPEAELALFPAMQGG